MVAMAGGILLVLMWSSPIAVAQSASEEEVKTAYIYNFVKFIDWPPEAFNAPNAVITFCALGRSPAADKIASLQGRAVVNHQISVRHLQSPEELSGCHVIFLAASAGKHQQRLLQLAHGLPALLIGEAPGFARAGGTINFFMENGKVAFEINPESAEGSRLKISSKVLALARIVTGGERRVQ